MSKVITKLSVSHFRSFKELKVDGLGGVNLITGRNNAGKSTLLEAIRIFATEGSPSTFFNILNYREETDQRGEEGSVPTGPEDFSPICSLFRSFPSLASCNEAFLISGENGGPPETLSARVAWFTEEFDAAMGRRLVRATDDLFGESSGFPALEVEMPNRRPRVIRLDRPYRFRRPVGEPNEPVAAPCIFLDPFSSRSTTQLAAFWDTIALTDTEAEVVKALQIISSDIQAVSMVGSDGGQRSRTAIAKSSAYSHPIPLRSLGDGVNRLFGLILSLACAKGGVLLVDEIENGLHHLVLVDIWRTVFRLARQLHVQVFATSHSWDCIEAFQKAANDDPEHGALVRLTRKDERIVATVFREKELQIVARDHIEVR